jgi:hypothetical protein
VKIGVGALNAKRCADKPLSSGFFARFEGNNSGVNVSGFSKTAVFCGFGSAENTGLGPNSRVLQGFREGFAKETRGIPTALTRSIYKPLKLKVSPVQSKRRWHGRKPSQRPA